jgi:hypothetical protein
MDSSIAKLARVVAAISTQLKGDRAPARTAAITSRTAVAWPLS